MHKSENIEKGLWVAVKIHIGLVCTQWDSSNVKFGTRMSGFEDCLCLTISINFSESLTFLL